MTNEKLNEQVVRGVAKLSRLNLSDDELRMFAGQLADIIRYIDDLNRLDTAQTEPTSHAVSGIKDVFREDTVKPSLSPDEALTNAPKRIGDFFGVPKIIE
ncbi:MAG: Asp-tRNA(Asn)/Glu-tRNA(Gln) amidotransferase subunit GatC [Candidatus Omnitrophica bacterium]|nr:Asp-tRNA(Asn)/Glu-tRNA(Gln) amidotransferase subunit GatC [Candidatus Omnitrophota bacterium]